MLNIYVFRHKKRPISLNKLIGLLLVSCSLKEDLVFSALLFTEANFILAMFGDGFFNIGA